MRATDLRIGNYVRYLNKLAKVRQIRSNKILLKSIGIPQIVYVDYIEPIELTEEILLKCPQIEKSDDYGDQKYFNLIGTKYFFCLDHDDFSFGIYNEKNNQSDITILNYFDLGISLHTFQNLIFALTNQELTINL